VTVDCKLLETASNEGEKHREVVYDGEQARTVDDSDKSSSRPVVNIKFAAIHALNDAPLINTKAWCG
jgi:hypothetical protein